MADQQHSAILLIHCPDQRGIVHHVTDFIFLNNGNILRLDQHVDIEQQLFFMRVEWSLDQFRVPAAQIEERFAAEVGERFNVTSRLHLSAEVQRMALFASQLPHCFYDILARYEAAEWQVEIPLIISNHEILRPAAERLGIDFHYLPITAENKQQQEQRQLELLQRYRIDFVVLARYMQILSKEFVSCYPQRVINIHHSFLPAFPGGRPYHSAHQRGVKIIGATSHYVTAELDAGPIIEQDVVRVTHAHTVTDLVRKGRDLEKIVLARAVWQHLNHNILTCGNRTVVFE
ncbi:MAG TPA: formyltetrahydrofolate deformylase [Gammaproteobacteria bacterium]|nr:formyltetrahydrofolate deformylase [Gammaproteobacteria bacterium]